MDLRLEWGVRQRCPDPITNCAPFERVRWTGFWKDYEIYRPAVAEAYNIVTSGKGKKYSNLAKDELFEYCLDHRWTDCCCLTRGRCDGIHEQGPTMDVPLTFLMRMLL